MYRFVDVMVLIISKIESNLIINHILSVLVDLGDLGKSPPVIYQL